ncbi:hypothetical protein PLICRDRAFT_46252 [Plicaturopsis crispa FD-325 SS-3]|uniref:CBD9-like protein n=1 Tax=Plicaturopsis crispa FD-325 SS-3 TaxID=944288 RepID=A0A0C9T4V4_PLICR|nr:hypothetical protein PLICRDRAFT_46252 [Plicaturopsis crispa FD-325 SS-3]
MTLLRSLFLVACCLFSLVLCDASLTGDSACLSLMCIAATTDNTTVQYVLQSTGKQSLGWMAIGFGKHMVNTPMVIMWPNADGNITLSQRTATFYSMPVVDSNPNQVATLSTSLSSASGNQPKFVFTVPATSQTSQDVIWAFGTDTPSSSAVDATFHQHKQSGAFTLDLTKAVSSSATISAPSPASTGASAPGKSATDDIPYSSYQRLIIVHAVLSTLGFLVFLPAGVLLARYLRTATPTWYTGHWVAQFALGGPIILIGIIFGFMGNKKISSFHLQRNHTKLGAALFALYVIQCVLGAVIHWIKPKPKPGNAPRRPPQNYLHAVLGLLIIALALWQVRTGYAYEWPETTGRGLVPNGVNVLWYIWVASLPVLYVIGLVLYLPRQFRQERQAASRKQMENIEQERTSSESQYQMHERREQEYRE